MDDSLDDFFAKKDKSSKKKGKSGKSKIVVSELLPASTPTPPNESNDNGDMLPDKLSEVKLDTPQTESQTIKEKKKTKKKKDRDGSDPNSRNEDDEWNDVRDEIDYSGLRIATKNIAKEAADEAAEIAARSEPEYDEDGQIIEKSNDGKVWKIVTADQEAPSEPTPPPAPVPVITEMPNVTGGRYVPPSMRGGGAAADLAPVSMKRATRKKKAPNVNSQEDFPTLGAAPPTIDYDVSKFERVRGGGSSMPTPAQSGRSSRLETSNMYSALERR